jgi:CheY-like chemotaxis protein
MPDATPQLRVLVIDDSVDNAEALCALLAVMGCLTAVAFGGTQGLAAALGFDPHLAFIDLEMPGMGGCEVARNLRAGPRGGLRLICLTGRGQADDRRTCMSAGFDDFFTKPMAPESLTRVLAESSAAL